MKPFMLFIKKRNQEVLDGKKLWMQPSQRVQTLSRGRRNGQFLQE